MSRNGREFGNCRLRQFGETVGALCATGVSYPPYSARRVPHVPPGAGEEEGDSVSAPVSPLTHAGNKSISALSALITRNRSCSHDDTRAIPSLFLLRPSLSFHLDAPSRAHAPPTASWQQVLDPALRSAAYPESPDMAGYRDQDG